MSVNLGIRFFNFRSLTLINCPNIAYSWKMHYLCIGKKYNNEAG